MSNQEPHPAQRALDFIAGALSEHGNNIAKTVGDFTAAAFRAQAQASIRQIESVLAIALAPRPDTEAQTATDKPTGAAAVVPIKRGRKPRSNGHVAPVPAPDPVTQ